MIIIKNEGQTIEYTQGDDFELTITVDEADSNTKLRFVIAVDEASIPMIDKQFSYNDGEFILTLNQTEKELLNMGNYIFKISLIDDLGKIVTRLSGNFIVKWGA